MIVGHAHPAVVAAVREAMGRGSSFGAPTQGESDLAARVKRVYPQIERMRFVVERHRGVDERDPAARGRTPAARRC